MRPFLLYYGAKWRIARLYPDPLHRVIVEPFAGGAGYSVRHHTRDVVLCDLDPYVVGVWRYLLAVTPAEILALPDVPVGGTVDDLTVCQEARWLIGWWLNSGGQTPRKRPSAWMRSGRWPGKFWGDRVRERLSQQVLSIRHWRVHHCDYRECPVAGPATWFVDPPYTIGGVSYRFGSGGIDYSALAEWCRARAGQTIVCEREGAGWLPFERIASSTGLKGPLTEAVWVQGGGAWQPSLPIGGVA